MPLSIPQKTIADAPQRFKVACCGRRFGKTTLAVREICKIAKEPNREVYYVSPSYRMSKTIVFKKLKQKLMDLRWVKKVNETELTFLLKNNSTISLKGADNYDSLRGVGLDGLIIDEAADIHPDAWFEVLRPALADKEGSALFLGTPKGMNWFKDLYDLAETDPDNWASFSYTTLDGGNVSQEEIAAAKRDMDARTFEQEFLGSFVNFRGRIAYEFDRALNIRRLDNALLNQLFIGLDFNVTPATAAVMVKQGSDLYVIDEVYLHNSNTNEIAEEIKRRYPTSHITCFPDPAGRQRRSSAGGQTDFTILQAAGFVVKAPLSHNLIRDRINSLNARLCSSDGVRRLFVDPKCKYTIESLEKYCYKEDTQVPEKGGNPDYSHMFDALSYAVDYLFPLKKEHEKQPPQRWGHKLATH
jgi:hypothetical protein